MIHGFAAIVLGWAVIFVDEAIQHIKEWRALYRALRRRERSPECEHCGGVYAGDVYRCVYCCGEVDFDRTSHPSETCICAAKEKP